MLILFKSINFEHTRRGGRPSFRQRQPTKPNNNGTDMVVIHMESPMYESWLLLPWSASDVSAGDREQGEEVQSSMQILAY